MVQYKKQHGTYIPVEMLDSEAVFTKEELDKLLPYLDGVKEQPAK